MSRRQFEMPNPPIHLSQIPVPVVALVAALIAAVVGWNVFCAFFRVQIDPEEVGIIVNKLGEDSGERFAYGWHQKGIMIETLAPGMHFFNSLIRDVKVVQVTDVKPRQAMVLIAKFGDQPGEGQIVAEDHAYDPATGNILRKGEKGPRRTVYGPGRYRINTEAFEVLTFEETLITTTGSVPVIQAVRPGGVPVAAPQDRRRADVRKAAAPPAAAAPAPPAPAEPARATHRLGLVKSKVGSQPPAGQILADDDQKGSLKRLLGPGRYYVHPFMRDVQIVEATDVPAGHVGVVTQLVGTALVGEQELATAPDQKGVSSLVLGPGTYYINPVAAKVDLIDARYQKQALEGDDSIRFPSTDSFTIEIDLAFEWRYTPGRIPETFVTLGDTEKVINNLLVQQARSIGRLEGSTHSGRDFIEGEPRQKFQENFVAKFAASCEEKGISVSRVSVKRIVPPVQIAERMRRAVVAQESLLANREKELTARIEADYQEAKAKVLYVEQQVLAETELKVREIEAEATKEKGLVEVETEKQVADLGLMAAVIEAQITEVLGQAAADGDRFLRQAKADGLKLLVEAFGKSSAYVAFKFAESFTSATRMVMSEETFLQFLDKVAMDTGDSR